MEVFNLSKSDIEALIKPLSKSQSIEVYRENPGTFSIKNRSFTPILFPNKYSPDPKIPALFQSITPAKIGWNRNDNAMVHKVYWSCQNCGSK
jgi:hypothetical protein